MKAKDNSLLRVETSDKKYEIVQEKSGEVSLYRHGEYWRDATGEKCILQLAYDIDALRKENEELKAIIEEHRQVGLEHKYDD